MPEVGDIVTVILWSGNRRGYGLMVRDGMLNTPDDVRRGMRDIRLVGPDAGRWFVVADAVRYQP